MDFEIQVICNVIGGIIVAIFTILCIKLSKKYYKYNFKRIFGKDSNENFHIVYGNMNILSPIFDSNGEIIKFPYYKPGKESHLFRGSSVVSLAEMRSAKYLSESFGKFINFAPKLISDFEIREKLDISFCSLGGHNNFKTEDVLNSSENRFFYFDKVNWICVKEDEKKRFCIKDNYDYGFIIKIIPKNFLNRVWIAVAGIGEWGTSGAVWFLSKKWNKMPKNKSFGMIIKVRNGQDESAEMIYKI